jgi:hypothetical protein
MDRLKDYVEKEKKNSAIAEDNLKHKIKALEEEKAKAEDKAKV